MKRYRLIIALSVASTAFLVYFISSANVNNWIIAVCDVGQGDAVIIRSGSSIAMVDMGPSDKSLDRCMKKFSVQKVDLLFISHYDRDHVGGYKSVAGKVKKVVTGQKDRPFATLVENALIKGGATLLRVYAGAEGLLGQMTWRTLWPKQDNPLNMRRGNNGSIVITFQSPNFSAIFLGDLGMLPQKMIFDTLPSGPRGKYDVVKVAHHGSADQFSLLYKRISAKYGIISAGKHNRYGHPTKTALDMLRKAGTQPLITSTSGYISIALNGNKLSVNEDRNQK